MLLPIESHQDAAEMAEQTVVQAQETSFEHGTA